MEKPVQPACPKCGSNSEVIRIVYGRPGQSLLDDADKGLVKLGGCSPSHQRSHCKKCKHDF